MKLAELAGLLTAEGRPTEGPPRVEKTVSAAAARALFADCCDFVCREVVTGSGEKASLVFIDGLISGAAVAEEVLQEARRLVKDGIDPDYYARIVRANYGSTLKSLNSFESIAISLVEGQFDGYDPLLFPEMFDSITPQDLLAFIRENLCREHMALSVVYPKE